MNWSNWSDFVAMGGRGFYVWGSFGVAAAAMLLEVWLLAVRRKQLRIVAAPGQKVGA